MHSLLSLWPQSNFSLLGIVLLMPAIGALVNGVFGKRLGREAVRAMALSALGVSFFASLLTFITVATSHDEPKVSWTAWEWLSITGRSLQNIPLEVKFSVDAMTATMMLVVTGVGFLIHLYASSYMWEDPSYHRFFAYLNLFCFAMLTLIMGDNLVVLFVGWEGVGLCSYLLIGFWFSEEKNASAGKKAFIVNRIGDFGLLVAMALLVYFVGSLSWDGIENGRAALLEPVRIWPIGNMPSSDDLVPGSGPWSMFLHLIIPAEPIMVSAATLTGLALFLGCAGKSAQLPLSIWLPDAMAGPTPVSALIHAATMVTAGVYLVARLSAVFVLSPFAMAVVAVVGLVTALFAASVGFFQNDLKKVLAYSTVSQLGFMFMGVGTGAFAAGFFHVFTHAFFKACLFLGAGSVIHAMHHRIHDTDASQDMANMGGLRKFMPYTHVTFLISCLAIAGVPGLSGFFSKDEILWKAFSTKVVHTFPGQAGMWQWPDWLGQVIYWGGIVGATMTAFYMFRAYFRTFWGEFRGWKIVEGWKEPEGHHHDDHGHGHSHTHAALEGPNPHESPWQMTLPLVVLAGFALLAGFLIAEPIAHATHNHHWAMLAHLLAPVFETASSAIAVKPDMGLGKMGLMMLPGVGVAIAGILAARHVYYLCEGRQERAFARALPGLHKLISDKWRLDEFFKAVIVSTLEGLAELFAQADKWIIDGVIAKLTAAVTAGVGTMLRALQTGRVQMYLASMAVGAGGVFWFFVMPHAAIHVDEAALRKSGNVTLSAPKGPGYTYVWSGKGVREGAGSSDINVALKSNETAEVTVAVTNAFGLEAKTSIRLERPSGAHKLRVAKLEEARR